MVNETKQTRSVFFLNVKIFCIKSIYLKLWNQRQNKGYPELFYMVHFDNIYSSLYLDILIWNFEMQVHI